MYRYPHVGSIPPACPPGLQPVYTPQGWQCGIVQQVASPPHTTLPTQSPAAYGQSWMVPFQNHFPLPSHCPPGAWKVWFSALGRYMCVYK